MRESLSNKAITALCSLLLLLPVLAYPNTTGVTVKKAEISLLGDVYAASADIDFQLSTKAKQALRSGVSLTWTYHFKVQQLNDYFWDNTLNEKSFSYRIQYHALLNMYRVKNELTGLIDNFSTLEAALDLLSTVRNFPLIEKDFILDKATYAVKIKIVFERDTLPLPLRPTAYLNPQWYLSSEWTEWPLKK